jgi:hypothetical protein
MRRILISIALAALALPSAATAHEGTGGNLGLGVGVGSPTALSIALAPVPWSAFELAIGLPALDEGNTYAHLVYEVDALRLASGPSVIVPLYLGAGGFVRDVGYTDFGARIPLGVSFNFERAPIQIFAEAALEAVLASDVSHDHPLALDGYVGARFWL